MDRFKISRKIMPVILSLVLVFSSFPISVAYAIDDSKLASVEAFTSASDADIDDSNKTAITVQYDKKIKMDWVAKDESIGRVKDGWWIGLKVVAPSLSGGYTVAELKNSKFKMTGLNGTAFTDYNFWDAQDSDKTDETEEIERYAGIWYFVNESVLNNAIAANKSLVSEMQFDWDNDDTYEQTINVSIDPEDVELYKEISSSKEKVYPVSGGLGKVQAITEASSTTVEGSETNTVSVVNSSEIKLDWSQNDTSIGRTKDGWWYGVKITAPAGMGQTELEKSKLQLKAHGKDAWTDAMDFWSIRDSGASATVWAGLWLFVDQALVDAGNDIIHRARIDWDGDGVYEQLITTTLDPAKINLDYSNFNAMDAAKPAFSNVTDNGTVWVGDRDTYVISGNVVDQGTESKGTTYTSGMDKVEYAVGSETAARNAATYNATNDSFEFTITDEFEGSYFIFAKDVQGNEEKKEITVKFDNKDPVLSEVAVDTSDWTNGKVVISGKVTDTFSGAQKVEYAYEKISTQSGGTVYPATDGTFSIEIPAQEYEGNIVLTAYDVAQRTSTQSIAVKMDNVSFSSATATPDPSAWTNGNITVTGAFADNTSGLKDIKLKKSAEDDSAFVSVDEANITFDDASTKKSGSYTYTISAQDYEGNYLVRFTDRAGNVSDCTIAVKADITKPEISTLSASPSTWTNSYVTISGKYSDNLSGVKEIKIKKDGDSEFTDVTAIDTENKEFSFIVNAQNYEGNYIVYCVDNAGNVSEEKTVGVKMDNEAPSNVVISYAPIVAEKILGALTFGFYKENVQVTLTSTDNLSGIKEFKYSYSGTDSVKTNNIDDVTNAIISSTDANFTADSTNASATFTIPAQFRGTVKASAVDNAGNTTANETAETKNIVVDSVAPTITASYPAAINTANEISYYNSDVTVTLDVTDENFMDGEFPGDGEGKARDIQISAVIKDDNGATINETYKVNNWARVDGSDTWRGTFTLSTEGDYEITINYTDKSGNSATEYKKDKLTIDKTAPVIEISYVDGTKTNRLNNNYFLNRTATITVTEHNFDKDAFVAAITAKNVEGTDVSTAAQTALTANSWVDDGNTHTLTIPYTDDANYTFAFTSLADFAKNSSVNKTGNSTEFKNGTVAPTEFTCDETAPTNVVVNYSESLLDKVLGLVTFGFYKEECEVTLTSTDATSGVQYFKYSYDVNDTVNTANLGGKVDAEKTANTTDTGLSRTYKFTIPAQFRGTVKASAVDNAGNTTANETAETKNIVVDNVSPVITATYPAAVNTANEISYYNSDITVTLDVTDENFMDGEFPGDGEGKARDIQISASIKDENNEIINETYTIDNWARVDSSDKWRGTFTLSTEGEYEITINYTDKSGNAATEYKKDKIVLGKTAPVIEISYENETATNRLGEGYFLNRTATIEVTSHNFDKDAFVAAITAKTVEGTDVSTAAQTALTANNWVDDGNVHTLTIPYTDDANYTFALTSLVDYAKNSYVTKPENNGSIYKNGTETPEAFACDETNPTNVDISYSSSVIDTVLGFITFGFYKAECEVTLTSTDATSGVQYFKYSYDVNDTVNTANAGSKVDTEKTANTTDTGLSRTYKFTIPAQFRGTVSASAVDNSGNSTTAETTNTKNIVVDNVAPTITASYPAAINTANEISYYNSDVTVTLDVTDENFMDGEFPGDGEGKARDIQISAVIKDDNGATINETYKVNNWARVDGSDTWRGTFTLSTEGDYEITINYTDKSGNSATEYKKDKITIDKTAPVIEIEYFDEEANSDTVRFSEKYYKNRKARITVVEHNFDKAAFAAAITAKDVEGTDVSTAAQTALTANSWTDDGNTHTLIIPYTDDANYTFAFTSLADFAKNSVVNKAGNSTEFKEGTIAPTEFTCDETAPTDVVISYSTPLREVILEAITFGFYKAKCDVTLTSEDATSGVQYFKYSYDVAADVNAENAGGKVDTEKTANTTDTGLSRTYEFTIPAQFRGTVKASAVDYSGNATKNVTHDARNIIADSIPPVVDIVPEATENADVAAKIKEATPEGDKIDTLEADGNLWFDRDVIIPIKVVDSSVENMDSGVFSVEIKVNGNAYQDTTIDSAKWDYTSGKHVYKIAENNGALNTAEWIFKIDTSEVETDENGKYKIDVKVVDFSTNESQDTLTIYKDIEAPEVVDFRFSPINKDDTNDGNATVVVLTGDEEQNGQGKVFGYYFKDKTNVTVQAVDRNMQNAKEKNKNTGVKSITFYTVDYSDPDNIVTAAPIKKDATYDSGKYTATFVVDANFKGQIFAYATDNIDNSNHTDVARNVRTGVFKRSFTYGETTDDVEVVVPRKTILETEAHHEAEANHITYEVQTAASYKDAKGFDLYATDVKIKVTVKDEYAGIREGEVVITSDENRSDETSSYPFEVDNAGSVSNGWKIEKTDDNLVTQISKVITVKRDSNNIELSATMTDRAYNTSEKTLRKFSIDKTSPTVVVSYDNNSVSEGKYFKNARTATIKVTERNFDPSLFNVIKNGTRVNVSWSSSGNYNSNTNKEGTVYTAKLPFSTDGDYTLSINGVDRVHHAASVSYTGVAPKAFTIDLKNPVVKVTYSSAAQPKNSNYYSKPRTATIEVNEHNWNPSKFVFSLRMNDGSVQKPELKWTNKGDIHTATFEANSVSGDKYTLDFECKDRADRDADFIQNDKKVKDYVPDEFYVDQTNPTIKYNFNGNDTGSNKSATTNKEFASSVSLSDTYYDYVNVSIVGQAHNYHHNIRGNHSSTVDIDAIIEAISTDDKTKDDFYTLVVDAFDKAGNTTQITRYFAVNRNGSIFELGASAASIVEKKYSNNINELKELSIRERNIDPIDTTKTELKVSIGGKVTTLKAGTDYSVSASTERGGNGYYNVVYTINPSVFKSDARYKFMITTKDAAGNTSKNSSKKSIAPGSEDLPILSFIYDVTAPTIDINLDKTKLTFYPISANSYLVEFAPEDDASGIDYNSVTLSIGSGDKKQVVELNDEEYEFKFDEETGKYSFVLKGTNNDVTFNFKDRAGNSFEELVFKRISVTTNALKRFFDNTRLFIGVLVGIVALATAIIILIAVKRKKKDDEEEPTAE